LEKAIQHLLLHHDALRLHFTRGESGWQQFNAGQMEGALVSRADLSRLSESEQGPAIEAAAAKIQSSLSLAEGPLIRAGLFDLGVHKPGRLLLVIHHLAVDGISWRILLEDLQTVYRQLSSAESVQLPPKTTSFKHWSERLTEYAQSAALQRELDYWLTQPWSNCSVLPRDFPEGRSRNIEASTRTLSVALSIEETQALLQEMPAAYNTQINDVLLTALAQAFSRWTGQGALLVTLEGHGREDIFDDVDLSRTVGWFTTLFPVLLELGEDSHPGATLKSIKEHLRRIPNRGIGYGMLRHLNANAAIAESLRGLPEPEVSFNYLGQFDQVLSETSAFAWAREARGPMRSLGSHRSHLLDINGSVMEKQLRVTWSYSDNIYRRTTMEALAENFLQALRSLIGHCRSHEAGGLTPSDFPLADLNQKELDELIAEFGEISS
jgi:non-ribosomal peptide synthase protein (TIGR01720 family)